MKLGSLKTRHWIWEELMRAKLSIRKWVQAFRWDPQPGLPSHCGLCASKHISFSFVSVLFLVRAWDSRQWERPSLLDMQDSPCIMLCRLRSLMLMLQLPRCCELSQLPGRLLNILCRSRWYLNKTLVPLRERPTHPPHFMSCTTFFLTLPLCTT